MLKRLLAAGVLALMSGAAPLIAAEPEDTAAPDAAVIEKGHAILEANCARCHGIGLEDSSKHEEAPPFRVVVTRYPPEDLAEALAEGIISGHPDMPEFVFQPEEIEAILAYLDTLVPANNGGKPDAK